SFPATTRSLSALPARLRVSPLARTGAIVLAIRLMGAVAALALQLSLARVLGHAGYGEYAYAFAWLQLMLVFAQGGFAMAALRYVSEYRAKNQQALARGFTKRGAQIVLFESVVLALVMAGCAAANHYH